VSEPPAGRPPGRERGGGRSHRDHLEGPGRRWPSPAAISWGRPSDRGAGGDFRHTPPPQRACSSIWDATALASTARQRTRQQPTRHNLVFRRQKPWAWAPWNSLTVRSDILPCGRVFPRVPTDAPPLRPLLISALLIIGFRAPLAHADNRRAHPFAQKPRFSGAAPSLPPLPPRQGRFTNYGRLSVARWAAPFLIVDGACSHCR